MSAKKEKKNSPLQYNQTNNFNVKLRVKSSGVIFFFFFLQSITEMLQDCICIKERESSDMRDMN